MTVPVVDGISIEPLASLDEIEAVMAVEAASFTNPWTREMYVSDLANTGVSHLYVARDADAAIVGFCSFWRVADELHINNLAVQPGSRRRGVARALLAAVTRAAADLGARRTILEVRRSNAIARQLYERLGFSVMGLRKGYYTNPAEDAVVLWRDEASHT